MEIIGIIVILTLPYMAGYILKSIMNIKEISQMEIYLIGFFFVLFLQGKIFTTGNVVLHKSFDDICNGFWIVTIIMFVLFILALIFNITVRLKKGNGNTIYHTKWSKQDLLLLGLVIITAAAVVFRVLSLHNYLRSDLMLATVRTTMSTRTMFEYNHIISQRFTLGLISSKKIITLPLYYAYLSSYFGIEETLLLYIILSIKTIMCMYFACMTFISPIMKNRRKLLIFAFFLSTLFLSGDYYSGSIGTRLLWNGYSGETIVAAVIIPYIMYVITDWYRQERNLRINTVTNPQASDKVKGITKGNIHRYIVNIFRLVLCLGASLFITGITSGILLVAITIVVLGVLSVLRFIVEEVNE